MIGFAILTAGTVDDKLDLLFQTFDKNADGFLEEAEVRNLLHILHKQVGRAPDNDYINRAWNSLDSEQTGRLDLPRFKELVQLSPILSDALALASRKRRKMRRLLSQSNLTPVREESVHLLSPKKRQALEEEATKERERLRQDFIKRSMNNRDGGLLSPPRKPNRASRRIFRRSAQT